MCADLIVLSQCFTKVKRASPGAQMVKNLPATAGDPGSIPGLGRSPRVTNSLVFLPGKSHGQTSLAG